jgi:hypothetical protein
VQYLDFDLDLIERPKHVCCAVFPQKVPCFALGLHVLEV